MVITHTKGNIANYPDLQPVTVRVEWYECYKKIMKKTAENGVVLGIRLDHTHGLRNGDVLGVEDGTAYVVAIAPCEALIVDAKSLDMVPKVCYEIGNRHAPFFRGDSPTEFYTPYEMPVKVMLERLGADVRVGMAELSPNRAISSSTGGGHSHSHDGGYDGKGGSCPEGTFLHHHHHHHHEG